MTFDIDTIAAALVDDETFVITGDEYNPLVEPGTWTFRLRIEPDDLQVSDIEDDEVFGRYEYGEYGRGSRDRPADFTGAAVKISSASSQGDYFWYEPPTYLRKFKGSGFATLTAFVAAQAANLVHVRNLLSWGYERIGVEVTHVRPDGYKQSWVEWLSGVESSTGLWGEALNDHDRYVAEIIREQLGEVIFQIDKEVSV